MAAVGDVAVATVERNTNLEIPFLLMMVVIHGRSGQYSHVLRTCIYICIICICYVICIKYIIPFYKYMIPHKCAIMKSVYHRLFTY